MLERLEWETLETRHAKYQLTMMFKIIHGLVDIPADDNLTAASTRTRAHHSHKFRHIPASTDYYIKKASFQRVTNDDIKEGMAEQGVTGVHRITVRRDGTLKPTYTFVLTFNSLTYLQLLK